MFLLVLHINDRSGRTGGIEEKDKNANFLCLSLELIIYAKCLTKSPTGSQRSWLLGGGGGLN